MFTIDGQTIAQKIRKNLKSKISTSGLTPGLAAVLVGDDPASKLYVSLKEKACAEVGIHFEKHIFPVLTSEETIIKTIKQLNNQTNVHGILVQLPLPPGFDTDKIIAAIDPKKDVDGFGPRSKAEPVLGRAVWMLIATAKEQRTKNKEQDKTLIVGKSDVFLQTMSDYLNHKGLLTKTTSPKDIKDIGYYDIVITAVGEPNFLSGNDFKDGAIVIDIGTNRLPDGRIVGDVDFSAKACLPVRQGRSTKDKEIWITPVPGGVGPVTVATLLENTYLLAQMQSSPPEADAPLAQKI